MELAYDPQDDIYIHLHLIHFDFKWLDLLLNPTPAAIYYQQLKCVCVSVGAVHLSSVETGFPIQLFCSVHKTDTFS